MELTLIDLILPTKLLLHPKLNIKVDIVGKSIKDLWSLNLCLQENFYH